MNIDDVMIDKQPLLIFHDLENNPQGTSLREWPLHMTIAPYFTYDGLIQEDVIDRITEISRACGEIKIEPDGNAMFGPKNDIPVTRFRDVNGELFELHASLIKQLGVMGCRFADLTYDYSPHISHKDSFPIPASIYSVTSITVATKLPKSVEHNKIILKKIDL